MNPDDPIPPNEESKTDNVIPFPVKPKMLSSGQKSIPKFKRGDWIRYYDESSRFSIAQIEYIATKENTMVFFTDRGPIPEQMVVETRKMANE